MLINITLELYDWEWRLCIWLKVLEIPVYTILSTAGYILNVKVMIYGSQKLHLLLSLFGTKTGLTLLDLIYQIIQRQSI
jgi:hypothetical protein